jgi:hypothetical protein
MPQKVNCRECQYYYITFDERAPYGCRAYGFKTKQMPSIAVYQSGGIHCQLFSSKNSKQNTDTSSDDKPGGFYA